MYRSFSEQIIIMRGIENNDRIRRGMMFFSPRTSMCTTRSDMVLASLFSSIILSSPNALDPRLSTGFRAVELLESDDECPEPSRLGVGVANRDRGSGGLLLAEPGAFVRGVDVAAAAAEVVVVAAAAFVPDFIPWLLSKMWKE